TSIFFAPVPCCACRTVPPFRQWIPEKLLQKSAGNPLPGARLRQAKARARIRGCDLFHLLLRAEVQAVQAVATRPFGTASPGLRLTWLNYGDCWNCATQSRGVST